MVFFFTFPFQLSSIIFLCLDFISTMYLIMGRITNLYIRGAFIKFFKDLHFHIVRLRPPVIHSTYLCYLLPHFFLAIIVSLLLLLCFIICSGTLSTAFSKRTKHRYADMLYSMDSSATELHRQHHYRMLICLTTSYDTLYYNFCQLIF